MRLVRACAVETHMDMLQEPFYMGIYWKNAAHQSGARVSCEPAGAVETHMDISEEPFCADFFKKNTAH